MSSSSPARIVAIAGDARTDRTDVLAREEPLEIRVQGVAIAVVMRTPGDDEDLTLGFLLTERLVSSTADVASIRHCSTVPDPEAEENVVLVGLAEGVTPPLEKARRNFYASSSCGICGKATIEAALAHGPPVHAPLQVTASVLSSLPAALRVEQSAFDATGGIHAAGLFDGAGTRLFVREDVGRHNAVDKIVGAAARAGIDPAGTVLLVSGRVGFEIVQKAAAFGIPIVAGISAPSSLAVRFGEALGVTVVGFLRGASMNVYAHPARVT
jgi:FdhD protein